MGLPSRSLCKCLLAVLITANEAECCGSLHGFVIPIRVMSFHREKRETKTKRSKKQKHRQQKETDTQKTNQQKETNLRQSTSTGCFLFCLFWFALGFLFLVFLCLFCLFLGCPSFFCTPDWILDCVMVRALFDSPMRDADMLCIIRSLAQKLCYDLARAEKAKDGKNIIEVWYCYTWRAPGGVCVGFPNCEASPVVHIFFFNIHLPINGHMCEYTNMQLPFLQKRRKSASCCHSLCKTTSCFLPHQSFGRMMMTPSHCTEPQCG